MSLRTQAALDHRNILANTKDFGWSIRVTNPAGVSAPLIGFSTDIAQVIDPDTGQAVSGRLASVVLPAADLAAVGLSLPVGVADTTKKPWVVEFNDICGNPYRFKVMQTAPDRAIGNVVCHLELYK